jgi:predicted transposase/invertase (TIGR01784 family)
MTHGQLLGQEAENRGTKKGLLKGLQNGMQAEKLQIAKNMLKKGFELTSIQEITGLTPGELQILK